MQKVRMAEDAWNTRDPEKVSLAYTSDSAWRDRSEFLSGGAAIVEFNRQQHIHRRFPESQAAPVSLD